MMKMTTMGTLGLALAVFAGSAGGQTTNPAKLKVNGVGLDSTYSQVVKALGKPISNGKPTKEECIGGREKSVKFDGATFYLMDGDSVNRKTFEVKSFDITSSKYSVSGIKVGDTELSVRRHLGTKFEKQDAESGANVWSYEFEDQNNPGFTTIYISKGKVTKITSGYMVC
jgi:hypothetical protein